MRIPVDTRAVQTTAFTFRPNGPIERYGLATNPAAKVGEVVWSARLLIGLSVGNKGTWTLNKVVALVKKFRTEQGEDPDATFFATRGLYTERTETRTRTITENSCQVVILHFGKRQGEFHEQMVDLGERLARTMKQDKIYVEIQRNGVSKGWWVVTQ